MRSLLKSVSRIESKGLPGFVQRLILSIGLSMFILANAAASPLISAQDLQQKLGQDNLVILEIQPLVYFRQAHIPGSLHTDYGLWRQTDSEGLGSMLPTQKRLDELIGGHGIDGKSEVVIVPVGQGADDLAAAARIYWTLYVAGLDRLSILEGGLLGYFKIWGRAGLVSGQSLAEPVVYEVVLREHEILNADRVLDYINQGFGIVDARSQEEYTGKLSGSERERPGALPGAVNLPFDRLMNATQSGLVAKDLLQKRFSDAGVSLAGNQLSYCHTGHRAALIWFAAHELLGNTLARLYDGSTLEWSSSPDLPLVNGLGIKEVPDKSI